MTASIQHPTGSLWNKVPPLVMGIMNVTPDSFYDQSRATHLTDSLNKIAEMVAAGMDILDLGAQSTRPGAERVSAETEWERLSPILHAVRERFPHLLVSVDTYHAPVATQAAKAGAHLINDIGAGLLDQDMLGAVAATGLPYCCMHNRGSWAELHQKSPYPQLMDTLLQFFEERLKATQAAGIQETWIDPGFGFGKTTADNFLLLKNLDRLQVLGCPILLGVSRKSSIYQTLGLSAAEALNGTTVLHSFALERGVSVLRVHDIAPAKEAIVLWRALQGQ